MCYICNCFAWSLDLLQRGITYILTCCISFVVCFGLFITVLAGIAFGYNYSFAEFITYTSARSDITVYMRRGQFYDNPDIAPAVERRMGDNEVFSVNKNLENEEQDFSNKGLESLPKKWLKDQDAREYAVKLTKYKGDEKIYVDEPELAEQQKIKSLYKSTLPSTWLQTDIPSSIPTTIWRSGSSEIILRKFLPLQHATEGYNKEELNSDFNNDNEVNYVTRPTKVVLNDDQMIENQPDIKIRFEDNNISERKLIPLSTSETNFPSDQDDLLEENDDNIIYKPV